MKSENPGGSSAGVFSFIQPEISGRWQGAAASRARWSASDSLCGYYSPAGRLGVFEAVHRTWSELIAHDPLIID